MRTLRCLGAGVIKSFGLCRASGSCLSSLFDRTEPSLRDREFESADPMRTTRGAGLPFARSRSDSSRGDCECRLSWLDATAAAAANARPSSGVRSLPPFCRRGDEPSPSSSRSAFTEALNLGSGTSSSELSPGEYCLEIAVPRSRDVEPCMAAEERLEPERETVARDN